MNELIKKLIVCVFLALSAGIAKTAEQTTPAQAAADPFGGSFGGFNSEPQPDNLVGGVVIDSKPQLFVRTVTLKFLKAANLKTALDKMSSKFGLISVDDNTNSLIICDTKEDLDKIVVERKNADQTPQQIMIEVVIIDVQLKDDTEIGVDWDILSTENKNVGYRQSMVFPNRLTVIPPTVDTIDAAMAFQGVGLGSELAIISNDIRNVINVLQEKRDVDILASPRVLVVSGQEAEIKTVEEIPYQLLTQSTGGGGGGSAISTTDFKEVGVTMQVKATVADDGKILMVVRPEQSVSSGLSVAGIPIIDRRQAMTTLLMDDGQVVVMGGLRRQEITHVREQVPLLGDLPIIGFIFADDRKIVENSELLVLLSPHIYKGQPPPAEAMARYNQIKNKTIITMPREPNSQSSYGTK